MKIVATIEARMTSSRLPGKVLLPAQGKPMLYHLVNRLKAVPSIREIILATTINATDDVLIDFARQENILHYRGSEEDVMSRVIGAAETARADVIVEITGDCPIIDPDLVEQTIQMYLHHEAAYVSNTHISSYPGGMDTQVFSLESLKRSATMTDDSLDHEHVSLHMRNHPEIFSHIHLIAPPSLHWPNLGLTLDEQADYILLKRIIETLSPKNPLFSCLDTIQLLKQNPDWLEINRHVIRKGNT
ncbi:putative acylneuraminate cytidylyltransferase CMP-KDO synthetase-like protein [Gloeomargarita lithophora Alchichica-D10]|uniref:Putative acylneuraminate cytidylyltransferase CMP-KDO synthetase-like protein n=1 Tax=Gloeomargarita lithophora Alchichica-D10 TaxID=1188229 RepID=A0A1J0AEZ9_9CYAN|nr:glycosyltransferase family protein [Gloeomargarita lithophora]APB34508.1 putative acylneuraminate cytidylyltransferase CMP-KDO synthetase-like protein [Gloeomargarita lithophora Alchichica-D10]